MTSFLFSAALIKAEMIGESFETLYKVIFIAITSGSSAALFMNSSTEVLNKSYG